MPIYREADATDLPALCILGEAVNAVHHAAFPDLFAGAPEKADHAAGHWARSIGQPMATTFVAEVAGEVVGFVTTGLQDVDHPLQRPLRCAYVGSIGVAAGHRRAGIARTLMDYAQAWARERGAFELRLTVWAFNDSAMRLYRSLGYDVRSHLMARRLVP